jgi:hypothetical protein
LIQEHTTLSDEVKTLEKKLTGENIPEEQEQKEESKNTITQQMQ